MIRVICGVVPLAILLLGLSLSTRAQDTLLIVSNGVKTLQLPLIPSVDRFSISPRADISQPEPDSTISLEGFQWFADGIKPFEFFTVSVQPKDSNAVLAAHLLNRISYGPTPDEVKRLAAIGPDAYLAEQLSPDSIGESLEFDQIYTNTAWQFITVTGTASSSTLYIYLTGMGDCYIDDLQLVRGGTPATGPNMIRGGDFESALEAWNLSPNLTNSSITSAMTHSGAGALHIVASERGSSRDSSIYQVDLGLQNNQTYTLSYWYKPGAADSGSLVVRLSGSGITSTPDDDVKMLGTRLETGTALLEDLRAWHTLRAVQSRRQLLEVLLQFFENHFVTQQTKSRDYLDRYYSFDDTDAFATRMEYMENKRWRSALLDRHCTFYDLLKISAESPAMIIYLDTVSSKGNGSNIANENYARELLELFTFGVDNGYDQTDITVLSRAWTGWSVRLVDSTNEFNPFAPQSTTQRSGHTNTEIRDLEGVWALAFRTNYHNTKEKILFEGKTVPARFGSPHAGKSYELRLPARGGDAGIEDGYDVLAHLANQPFTQEYISVKLCQLFVHDDFHIGYDFTDPSLSPEGRLVRDCMQAWEQGEPKGQIREVLSVIFNSALFRSQDGTMQKVKNPFEFTVSAIRALRARTSDGTFTAETDGYSVRSPINRMGRMRLFDRDNPDGYPDSAGPWISAGTLAERLRFVQSYLIARGQSGRSDAGNNTYCDPVKLLKSALSAQFWNDADAVATYFLSILYPGEGKANLAEYKMEAVSFLNSDDSGAASSPLAGLSNTSTAYDNRVRGMVAMLMTLPRFQEQ